MSNKSSEIIQLIQKYREENSVNLDPKIRSLDEDEVSALPSIPEGWTWLTSNEISKFITNGVHSPTSPEDTAQTNKRVLRITDINDEHQVNFSILPYCTRFTKPDHLKTLKKNDIYISFTGNKLGKIYLVKEDMSDVVFAHYFVRWQPIVVNPEYIYYVLLSNHFYRFLQAYKLGSSQPNLKVTDLKRVPLPIPPIKEQEQIAVVLSCLDRKIENLRKQNETLEKIAQTLFKHWFVDFEFPFDFAQGKPSTDGKPYKSSGGAMVPSELGEIPAGWRISDLGSEVETLGGGTPSTKEPAYWVDGDIPWYSPTDLTKENTLFSLGSEKQITKLGLQKSSAKLFPEQSILITSRATIGVIAINTQVACTNQGFITLIPNEKFTVHFLHGWLQTQLKLIKQLASGSTFPELSKSDFRKFVFLVPHSKCIRDYDRTVISSFQKIENNTRQIQTLTKTRDVLLPKLMSGKLRVGDD